MIQTRKAILGFEQGMNESFCEAWARLKGYTRACPHHGFKKEAILSIFYRGVDKEHKWTLDVASKGRFATLAVDHGELLVENLAQNIENFSDEYARAERTKSANEEQGRTEDMKALYEKLDANAAMMDKQASLIEKLISSKTDSPREVNFVAAYGDIQYGYQEDEMDMIQQEAMNSIGNQGSYTQKSHTPSNESQEPDLNSMFQQLLKDQSAMHTKLTSSCMDLNIKLETISNKIEQLESTAATSSLNADIEKQSGGRSF